MIQVSFDQLADLFPKAKDEVLRAVASHADEILSQYGINETLNRLSFFFAQVGHESAGLTRLEESFYYRDAANLYRYYRGKGRFGSIAEAAQYVRNPDALRKRLYGDGPSYYGRGLIQLTNKDNYEAVGAIVGLPLATDPDLAADPDHVLRIACGYWKMRDINQCADHDDYDGASKRINPAEPNLAVRRTYLKAALQIFSGGPGIAPVNPSRPSSIPEAGASAMLTLGSSGILVKNLQETLEKLNYSVGKTDGVFGRVTRAAVAAFQIDNGLEATGDVDDATVTALATAAPRAFDAERTNATASDVRKQGSRTVANADYVRISGLITALLGAFGVVKTAAGGGGTSDSTANAAATGLQTATEQLLTVLKGFNGTGQDISQALTNSAPQLVPALDKWISAVSAAKPAACQGDPLVCTFGQLGDTLLPAIGSLLPVGIPGSVILAALGVGAHLFGNRIVNARVEDYRTGKNLGR